MKLLTLLLILVISLNAKLTKEQIHFLKSPIVKESNNTLYIEEYYKVVFKKEIETPFDDKKHKFIIQKNLGVMKKGTINKEQFISMFASGTNELEKVIFMPLVQFGTIDHVEMLFNKPKSYDLLIKIDVKENGVDTTIKSKKNSKTNFIPFEKFFNVTFDN